MVPESLTSLDGWDLCRQGFAVLISHHLKGLTPGSSCNLHLSLPSPPWRTILLHAIGNLWREWGRGGSLHDSFHLLLLLPLLPLSQGLLLES